MKIIIDGSEIDVDEYVIEADNKKAKFYVRVEDMKRLYDWQKSESDEIEIEFIGTCNQVD